MQQFFPTNEPQRLEALQRYRILDTEPEARFDDVVTEAADKFGVPMALFSLVDKDRQWFKSRHGFAYAETERTGAFCSHTIAIDAPLVVENAREHLLFANSLLVKASRTSSSMPACPCGHRPASRWGRCASSIQSHAASRSVSWAS